MYGVSTNGADLVVVTRRGKSKAFMGDGKGFFSSSIVLPIPGKGATGIVAADMDFDGDVDLIAALRDEQPSVVLTNHGNGHFKSTELPGSVGDHRQALAGQFTNDKFQDVVLLNRKDQIFHSAVIWFRSSQ